MTDTVERMLAEIREFFPRMQARAAGIEAARQLSVELMEILKTSGAFNAFSPRYHGGIELDFPSGMKVVTEPSKKGSIIWAGVIASASTFSTAA
jgi:hypothetical protein